MSKCHKAFAISVLFLLLSSTAGAQTCYVKWVQPPNMIDGFDTESWVYGATDYVAADDWLCMDATPVDCVRWWGSYIGWASDTNLEVPPPVKPLVTGFLLSWHVYEPPPPYSRPGPLLAEEFVVPATVEWFGPVDDFFNPGFWEHEYLYEATLATPWPQIPGTTYFLNIQAVYGSDPLSGTEHYIWGWKNTEDQWNDDAVWSPDGGTNWFPMTWPFGHRFEGLSMDLAFELGWIKHPSDVDKWKQY